MRGNVCTDMHTAHERTRKVGRFESGKSSVLLVSSLRTSKRYGLCRPLRGRGRTGLPSDKRSRDTNRLVRESAAHLENGHHENETLFPRRRHCRLNLTAYRRAGDVFRYSWYDQSSISQQQVARLETSRDELDHSCLSRDLKATSKSHFKPPNIVPLQYCRSRVNDHHRPSPPPEEEAANDHLSLPVQPHPVTSALTSQC